MPENGDHSPEFSVVPESEEPVVTLYRAVTGVQDKYEEGTPFIGVSDDELLRNGIFSSNWSRAEEVSSRSLVDEINIAAIMEDYYEAGRSDLAEIAGMYPGKANPNGLPVFTSLSEAQWWLDKKNFPEEPPAIVVVKIPISLLSGEGPWRLFENRYRVEDVEVGREALLTLSHQQQKGRRIRSGEHYLRTVEDDTQISDDLRAYETIFRPDNWQGGKYAQSQPLVQVELGNK